MESHTASYMLTLEPKREDIWVLEAHLGVLEAHPGAENAYSGYMETHTKVLEVYSGDSGLNLERGAYLTLRRGFQKKSLGQLICKNVLI